MEEGERQTEWFKKAGFHWPIENFADEIVQIGIQALSYGYRVRKDANDPQRMKEHLGAACKPGIQLATEIAQHSLQLEEYYGIGFAASWWLERLFTLSGDLFTLGVKGKA